MKLAHAIATYLLVGLSVVHVAMTPVFFSEFAMRVMWYVAQGLMGLFVAFLNIASRRLVWRDGRTAGMTHGANLLGLVFAILYAVVDASVPSYVAIGLFSVLVATGLVLWAGRSATSPAHDQVRAAVGLDGQQQAPVQVELATERLILRQLQEKDFESFAGQYADEAMAQFIGGTSNREQAWRRMAALIGHWTLRGHGYWAVEEKTSGRFVGCVGLWFSDGWPELELGYWLTREVHGKGYATEAARRARDYAFDTLGAGTLVSYIHPDNEASKRVAERLGACNEQEINLLDFGPHCVYRYPRPVRE